PHPCCPSSPTRRSSDLDLNTATAEQLESLPGVGPSTAAAIVDDRDRNGPFASVDDLDRVPGIGPTKLAALRDLVTVGTLRSEDRSEEHTSELQSRENPV